ncbi:hypothetical protein CASFOL_023980 [Castilleja foliolosa]|uniref:Uncharacterized protein n=1 Tax=Castilleja foliolosa TaxID=1961234 RepID=A0ABD3CM27_9LAMI
MEISHSADESGRNNFELPVDSEHKATEFKLFSVSAPHMRAFHLSWISFFACFVSTFAAPPLLPIIRDDLDLTATDIGNAGVAAVSGAVFARVAMGTACDLFGPRLASATLTLLTAPAVYCTSTANSPVSFLLARFFTGFSLATFVSTQFWMSSLFSSGVVGTANGVAAGWGNLGGGATQLIMPLVFHLIECHTPIPHRIHHIDLPDGNYSQLHKSGDKHKDKFTRVLYHAVTNYRGWVLALTYGYCFGVELTVDNIIAQYFYDRFDVNLHTAGVIAASFGLANIFSRPAGGMLSDVVAKRFGMRGRLWALWIVQTLGGVFCIVLGKVGSLGMSIAVMLVFSVFVQAACGLTFGVVPFVSSRSLGIVSGMTGDGGNVGAVLTQVIFFRGSKYSTETGITYMGVMMVCCTLVIIVINFPQWGGGMLCGPSNKGTTEEDYYMSEWTSAEREKGFHRASLKFAENSRNERGNGLDRGL